jgi:hypothetical protein
MSTGKTCLIKMNETMISHILNFKKSFHKVHEDIICLKVLTSYWNEEDLNRKLFPAYSTFIEKIFCYVRAL